MAILRNVVINEKEREGMMRTLLHLDKHQSHCKYQKEAENYLRKKLKTFYGELPSDYHLPLHRYTVAHFLLNKYLGDTKGKNILHIGCNYGPFVHFLREEGAKAWGLDTNKKAAGYSASQGEPFVIAGDAKEIPFAKKSLDCVLSTNFITEDYLDTGEMLCVLSESHRIIKGSGLMILSTCHTGEEQFLENTGFQEAHHIVRENGRELVLWPEYVLIK